MFHHFSSQQNWLKSGNNKRLNIWRRFVVNRQNKIKKEGLKISRYKCTVPQTLHFCNRHRLFQKVIACDWVDEEYSGLQKLFCLLITKHEYWVGVKRVHLIFFFLIKRKLDLWYFFHKIVFLSPVLHVTNCVFFNSARSSTKFHRAMCFNPIDDSCKSLLLLQ